MSVITELGLYNGSGHRHDSIASGSYDALSSTSGRLSSLEVSSDQVSYAAALQTFTLTVHRHRRRHPLVFDVTLPAWPPGTTILLNLPCKYFHIPMNLFPHDQGNILPTNIASFIAHTLIWVRNPPFGEIQYRLF